MTAPLQYCSMPLTRHTDLCRDPEWLNQQLASDSAKVITLWSQKNMVRMIDGHPHPVYLPISEAALILANASEVIYLGHDQEAPVFAADLANLEDKEASRILGHAAPDTAMVELRKVGSILDAETGSLFAYARGLAWWHQQNGFCARCGGTLHSRQGGHARHCDRCGKELFPRIDPAVIMLIELENPADGIARCLLGRGAKWEKKVYSTLAGYVDAGESLEQAVIREIKEEADLTVTTQPRYIASQPWPFPGSIMLGFRATTNEVEIQIDQRELTDARWFSRAELLSIVGRPESEAGSADAVFLPPNDSIARLLIDQWLAEGDSPD